MGYIKWSRDRWRHVTLKGKIRHSSAIVVVDSVRDLGVITIDSQLCSLPMEYGRAIVALCRGGYYQLRQSTSNYSVSVNNCRRYIRLCICVESTGLL